MTKQAGEYPDNWPEIAERIKGKAGWKCERCAHPHDPENGYCLTVHHLTGEKWRSEDWALAALCQRCHLHVQATIRLGQLSFFEAADWLRPHIEGYEQAQI